MPPASCPPSPITAENAATSKIAELEPLSKCHSWTCGHHGGRGTRAGTPAHLVHARAMFAKAAGAGAVLMLPGLTGFDSMVQLARDDAFALPILAHPAMLGSHVRAGFSHEVWMDGNDGASPG